MYAFKRITCMHFTVTAFKDYKGMHLTESHLTVCISQYAFNRITHACTKGSHVCI